MHRFFITPENIIDENRIVITGDDVNHIARSLRLQAGEKVIASTGDGIDYLVELVEIGKEQVVCQIISTGPSQSEPTLQVTLFQGLPKSDKLDLIVQKCTELGISSVIPVETSRTIVKLNDKKADRRIERWQKIAEEAAKQSGRGRIPVIGPLAGWREGLQLMRTGDFDLILVPWEGATERSIRQVLTEWRTDSEHYPKKIGFVIGPEGGLSTEEVQEMVSLGAQPVTLGTRILRTETAGFAVLTILMYEFFEMEGRDRR